MKDQQVASGSNFICLYIITCQFCFDITCYGLQINSIVDASAPFHGQLVKAEGKENDNVDVSATQGYQSWVKQYHASLCIYIHT